MRIAMQNNTNLPTISLDNLNTVTGGYHDPVPPAPRSGPDAADGQHQGTLVSHLSEILNNLANRAGCPAPQK
jgi:hypothetical protein